MDHNTSHHAMTKMGINDGYGEHLEWHEYNHSSTAPQLHSSTAPQLHSSTAPQLHSSTAPQLRPNGFRCLHLESVGVSHGTGRGAAILPYT